MLPLDIYYARERYNDMLAEAEARRLIKANRAISQLHSRPKRAKLLIARVFEAFRPRRVARAH